MNNQDFIRSITLDGEEWRDVVGFENLYKVSSFGRIVSLGRYTNNRFQSVYKEPHLMTLNELKGRRAHSVILFKEGKGYKFTVPRLVAMLFLPQVDKNYVLEAKDGNFYNSKTNNLYWRRKTRARKLYSIPPIDGEEWKPIAGYEDLYEISSMGRVKSSYSQRLLIPSRYGKYLGVTLVKDSTKERFYIHRLVASAFIPNNDNLPCVDHINTERYDNRVLNLRWCTYLQNSLNPLTSGKLSTKVCQLKGKKLIKVYNSGKETKKYGFCPSSVSLCCRGLQLTHKGNKWMFLSDYESLINKSKNTHPTNVD
jgi:hypothetical protein